ncbi:hypothetical protein GCM10025787_24600 [Saccharopolyspora rosea]|uniref:Uncharacterized protein n=1 Tax=Saccharopolyspora rosea TaxID=524884 RepID=A0ABW3FR98_9PSEU
MLNVASLESERVHLAQLSTVHADTHGDRTPFSCKEMVYKAGYPIRDQRLGFEDARLEPGPATFTASATKAQDERAGSAAEKGNPQPGQLSDVGPGGAWVT